MKKLVYLLILVFASTLTHAQVKIGANPGTIGSSSNLEVEATSGNKTIVDKATGQVTIQDGSQGAGKILTSDANGASSWQPLATQNTTVMLSVSANTGQLIGANATATVNFTTKIFDKGNNFDLSTDRFIIPSDGYYSINIAGTNVPTTSGSTGQRYSLYMNGVLYRDGPASSILAGSGYTGSFTTLVYAKAGDYFTATAYSNIVASNIGAFYLDAYKVSN